MIKRTKMESEEILSARVEVKSIEVRGYGYKEGVLLFTEPDRKTLIVKNSVRPQQIESLEYGLSVLRYFIGEGEDVEITEDSVINVDCRLISQDGERTTEFATFGLVYDYEQADGLGFFFTYVNEITGESEELEPREISQLIRKNKEAFLLSVVKEEKPKSLFSKLLGKIKK